MLLEEAQKAVERAEYNRDEYDLELARIDAELAQAHALIVIAGLLNMVIGTDYECGPCVRVDTGWATGLREVEGGDGKQS